VLAARRSPKRATVVAVFDELVAWPSLLTHPNLTIEVLLLREDHIRRLPGTATPTPDPVTGETLYATALAATPQAEPLSRGRVSAAAAMSICSRWSCR